MKRKKRLIWQIYPYFLLVTVVSVAGVGWFASQSLQRFSYAQTAADLEARAVLLTRQIARHLSPLDPEALDRVCKAAGRSSRTRITVVLQSGLVVGDSESDPAQMDNHAHRPEIQAALSGRIGTSIRFSDTLTRNMMYVAVPVTTGEPLAAILRTAVSLSGIDREIRRIRLEIIGGGLFIAAVISAISFTISRRLSRPLVEMKQGAVEFAGGNLNLRIAYPESQEMAELAEALNRMAEQLDDRIKTILRQRNELETVLSSMQEGVLAVDKTEAVLSMNPAAGEMFEVHPAESPGKMIQEVIRNNDMQRLIATALSGKEPLSKDIVLHQKRERTLNAHTTPLLGAAQEQIGVLVVLDDVTQLRRLETMRRDFVANVSHEIKTPLTAIKGFVETLRHGAVDNPQEAEKFLGIIEKHVNRLSAIIDDLLKLSRIEQEDEDRKLALESHPLQGVIQSALQVCQAKADAKTVTIELGAEDGVQARIDPHLIEQAAVNLLDNAITYSNPGGSIRVEIASTESETFIRFQDHGIGIAREHLPRLFERFYRVDKARSRKMGGTGLGLSIVKHIAQAHGGTVTVESAPGKGSTFAIHLPKA